MSLKFDDEALDALEVVIPNLNWRYSGGTAVNRTIAPLIAKRWRAAWFGPDRPDGIATLSLSDLVRLRFRPSEPWQSAHLARAPQRRDAGRTFLEPVRLRLCADLQFGFSAPENLAHQFSHRAHGRRDRDQRGCGAIYPAAGDGHPSRHRRRSLCPRPPTASPPSPRQACPENTGSERSAACASRKAATCSSRRCAGSCRAIRIFAPS